MVSDVLMTEDVSEEMGRTNKSSKRKSLDTEQSSAKKVLEELSDNDEEC